MGRSWWSKFLLLAFSTVMAVLLVLPTLLQLQPEGSKFPFRKRMNLGLDLQGGVYMVLGVDFVKVFESVLQKQEDALAGEVKKQNLACGQPIIEKASLSAPREEREDPKLKLVCQSESALQSLMQVVKKELLLRQISVEKTTATLGLSREYRDDVRSHTISQSIEVVRNRIDEFGVAEPVITSQGQDRLSVELPGVKDIERAKGLIGRTAKLVFKIVADDKKTPEEVAALVAKIETEQHLAFKEGDQLSHYVQLLNEGAKSELPQGTEIAFQKGEGNTRYPYLLYTREEIAGEDLRDAMVQMDPTDGRPVVTLRMNTRGAQKFDQVTSDNKGKRMAIVLDGIVQNAPVIESRIPDGNARITLGVGDPNKLYNEARDLSVVLRAGALPAQLEFQEQRVVGPSLGQDSVEKGKWASIIGCLAVFFFMLVYYRKSGLLADVSLILNVLFVLAILVMFEATLTLPGIAGIALTVGIAVDSNVVIYERIREELRSGRDVRSAVEMGFDRAFRTILDANITNAFASLVLMNFGTGPIKGFAVTLLIGIITTVFTAVFASKVMFDAWIHRHRMDQLSI